MAVVNITDLYGYFETGDKPTQQQFVNLIDTLNANKGIIELPAGVRTWESIQGTIIDDIVVLGGSVDEYYVTCGITDGGNELLNHEFVSQYQGIFPVKHRSKDNETIYFSELDEEATIKLYIK